MMRMSAGCVLAGALLILGACESPTYPFGAVEFSPPTKYRVLWRTTELCAGRLGDFESVRWFVTPLSATGRKQDIAGAWFSKDNRIYLNAAFADDEQIVRHEMLHALLRASERGHQPEFLGSCGGIVTCVESCVTEAGGIAAGPTAASPTVSPSELAVSVTLVSPEPDESGWMAVVLSATNLRPAAVWVDLSGRPGVQFECIAGPVHCATHYSYGSAPGEFRASETRQEVSTFQIGTVPVTVRTAYNTVVLGSFTLVAP